MLIHSIPSSSILRRRVVTALLGVAISASSVTAAELHPLGAKVRPVPLTLPKVMTPRAGTSLPPSVDLSSELPPVGDQGSIGSCTAWAVGYAMKSHQERAERYWDVTDTAHQFSALWIYNQINGGYDGGSYIEDALDLLRNQGCDTLANFNPGDCTTQPSSWSKAAALPYRIVSWTNLAKDETTVKSVLSQRRPVVIAVAVYPDFDSISPTNPVYNDTTGTSRGNHAIALVGYDDARRAYKFINSWGPGWGIDGYGWIAYDFVASSSAVWSLYDAVDFRGSTVSGKVYHDANVNAYMDENESALSGWRIYDDANNNGIYDTGEISALTDYNGNYVLEYPSQIDYAEHYIREQVQADWKMVSPSSYRLVTGAGTDVINQDFGNFKPGKITGNIWHDTNRNGIKESGDGNLPQWTVYADLDNDGAADSATANIKCNFVPISIPDNGSTTGFINVAGLGGIITDVNVTIDVTHPYSSDLEFYLIGPMKQRVKLAPQIWPTGANFTNTTFDDEATTGIGSAVAPFTGKFKPVGSLTAFDGCDPNGYWYLEIVDRASRDEGVLNAWSLQISYTEPKAVSDGNGNFTIGGLNSGSYVVREICQSGWIPLAPFSHTAAVSAGATASGKNFANYRVNSFAGHLFNDLNANGVKDAGEVGIANWRVFIDANNDGVYNTGTATRASNNIPKDIPDPGQVTSTLPVSGITGLVTDVNVNLSIIHPYDGDVRIYLTSPIGRRVELVRNLGDSGDNFSNTTFDDEAPTSVTAAAAPFTGRFKPQSPLSVFDGFSPNGTWTLEVQDTAGSDIGTLSSWQLIIGYAEASMMSNTNGNYAITNIPAGTFRIDEVVPADWYMVNPTAGYHQVTVGSGAAIAGKNFANKLVPKATN